MSWAVNRRTNHRGASYDSVKADKAAFTASLLYGLLMSVTVLLQYLLFDTYSPLPFFCMLAFFTHLSWIRHSVSDPFTILLLFGFVYSAFPLLFGIPGSWPALKFGFDGAAVIYAVGSIAMVFGVAVSIALIPDRRKAAEKQSYREPNKTSKKAGLVASLGSLIVSLFVIVKTGSALTGDISYGDAIRRETTAGAGVFNLASPLAAGGLALMLTSNAPLRFYHHAIGLAAYAALFVSNGQRKSLIIPAILYGARYIRINSLPKLLLGMLASAAGLLVFLYLGFLRTAHAGFSQALNSRWISNFANGGGEMLGGEAVPVFATASAAHAGFVRPLPLAGDYLRSWMMSVPHFLWRNMPFEPLNERFAHIYMPSSRVTGMGWGFSFFGEAFLVGGYPVVAVATIAIMLLFRWSYLKGGGENRSGFWGAASLALLPFAFWFQRNALAYFIKEAIFSQLAVIFIIYFSASMILKRQRPASPSNAPTKGSNYAWSLPPDPQLAAQSHPRTRLLNE